MNIDYKMIGGRIQKFRKERGMTQEALAERLDVSVGYISQVERGITKISLDLLGAISSALGCDVAALVSGSAVAGSDYLSDELAQKIAALSPRDRRLLLGIADLLEKGRP